MNSKYIPSINELGFSFGITTLFYSYMIEKNIGNIWIRDNELGTKTIRPFGLVNFMFSPFYKKEMWYPSFLINNYLAYSLLTVYPIAIGIKLLTN